MGNALLKRQIVKSASSVDAKSFSYTGGIQSYTVPLAGWYKLEVWGASGTTGQAQSAAAGGGQGGYSRGYVKLNKGQVLYICCGGQPYNGGGNYAYGSNNGNKYSSGYGGGATHIAKVSGTLTGIGKTSFDANGLIVAGGGAGGGATYNNSEEGWSRGGNPGGPNRGGNSFGQGVDGAGNNANLTSQAGGGGYEGGSSINGGKSWVGGCTSWNGNDTYMQDGGNTGTGKATITLMAATQYTKRILVAN